MNQNIDEHSKQYSECADRLLKCLFDCTKYGHGEIVVKVSVTSRNKRDVRIKYGRNHKFLFSTSEITEVLATPAKGALNEEHDEYA